MRGAIKVIIIVFLYYNSVLVHRIIVLGCKSDEKKDERQLRERSM